MELEIEGAGVFTVMTRRTLQADIALSNLLRATGTGEALIAAHAAGEELEGRIFRTVSDSGKLFDILAAALVPLGTDPLDWTPELAKETAAKLRRVTSEGGKRTLLAAIAPLVMGFFLLGLHSSVTSPKFSPPPASPAERGFGSAATTITATGGSWFASWRDTIRSARRQLFGGH